MKFVCPSCHVHGGAELFTGDADAREACALLARLPADLGPHLLRYMRLFAPPERALAWSRVRRIAAEVAECVEQGAIRRHRREWKADARAWVTAINQMLDQRASLRLPLTSNGYLFAILEGLADKQEAKAESETERQRREGADLQRPHPLDSSRSLNLPAGEGEQRHVESSEQRIARMRREAIESDAKFAALNAQAPKADRAPMQSLADKESRRAAEQEIEQRRERSTDPRALSEIFPAPQHRGST